MSPCGQDQAPWTQDGNVATGSSHQTAFGERCYILPAIFCSIEIVNVSVINHVHIKVLDIHCAAVQNANIFSHLLPGCSCGSKHLLLSLY